MSIKDEKKFEDVLVFEQFTQKSWTSDSNTSIILDKLPQFLSSYFSSAGVEVNCNLDSVASFVAIHPHLVKDITEAITKIRDYFEKEKISLRYNQSEDIFNSELVLDIQVEVSDQVKALEKLSKFDEDFFLEFNKDCAKQRILVTLTVL